MRAILITAPASGDVGEPVVHQVNLHAAAPPRTSLGVDLLLLDARGMTAPMLTSALAEVARVRSTIGLRHSVLIRADLDVKLAVTAMRAGFSDIQDRPLGLRQLLRLIRQLGARHGGSARLLLDYARILPPPRVSGEASLYIALQKKEQIVRQLQENIGVREKRLEEQLQALKAREDQVKAAARRIDEDFARLQLDEDLVPAATLAPTTDAALTAEARRELESREAFLRQFEAELQGRAEQLDRQARILANREKLMEEFEQVLQSQAVGTPR